MAEDDHGETVEGRQGNHIIWVWMRPGSSGGKRLAEARGGGLLGRVLAADHERAERGVLGVKAIDAGKLWWVADARRQRE